jgi:Uma2 family endonuclease
MATCTREAVLVAPARPGRARAAHAPYRRERIAERSQLSAAEYLAWERTQPGRHEFFHGEVLAMARGSPRHNALASRVNAARPAALAGRGCEIFMSDQRVGFGMGERYIYPDVTDVCGAIVLEPGTSDVITNPTLIVEVLSGSTEQYDPGLEWEGYQRVDSLTDYILVSQTEPRMEHYRRDAGATWTYRALGPGERVRLTGEIDLDVDSIFAGVFALPGD